MNLELNSYEMQIIKQLILDANLGRKIRVIKGIRLLTGEGLREAKDWVDEINFTPETEVINLRNELNQAKNRNVLLEKSRLDLLSELERKQYELNSVNISLKNSRTQIDFLKSIIFQYDEFDTESLNKSIIAYLATRSNNG